MDEKGSTVETNRPNMLKEIANFIFTSKYARYSDELGRRETWDEAVSRLEQMHLNKFESLAQEDLSEIHWAFDMVRNKKVVPSMRSLQFGGKAIEVHNSRLYNCAVTHIHSLRSFAEVFYLLLCGSGVGLGLSDKFLSRLPELVPSIDEADVVEFYVEDTIEGWAESLEVLLKSFHVGNEYSGKNIEFKYDKIRPKGTRLMTSGGVAPGHEGLKHSHDKIKTLLSDVLKTKNTKLSTVDAYDILMHAADAVLSGGVRRAATSVMFRKNDELMMNAKVNMKADPCPDWFGEDYVIKKQDDGSFKGRVVYFDAGRAKVSEVLTFSDWEYNNLIETSTIGWHKVEPQRARSNNSVLLLRDDVTKEEFAQIVEKTKQWGEPGFVFASHEDNLFNPCFEISFIPITKSGECGVQFCNLTSVNGAKVQTREDFLQAVKAATIIGTLQASYTDFTFLSPTAKELTEEESLLGVSITAMMDNPEVLLDPIAQKEAAEYAVETNKQWAKKLNINQAARVTCIKPEGTSTIVLESMASGIHPVHAQNMFRRVQMNKIDPVYRFFKEHNPHLCEESMWSSTKSDDVVTFPLALNGSMTKADLNAIKHLEIIKSTQENWVITGTTEVNTKPLNHNVSCTVVCKDEEWDDVINYLYTERDYFTAVSLIGYTGDKDYVQSPMEEVKTDDDFSKFEHYVANYKSVDYTKLVEGMDMTSPSAEAVCAGGVCSLV